MAKISVAVPVYNVEEYLDQCIRSILGQSFKDFELILVNDGSTDGSGKLCDYYKKKDPRISVIHQENQGLSMARNKAIEFSKASYITFIDSDDYIDKNMLEILYRNLTRTRSDIAVCNYNTVENGNALINIKKAKISLLTNIEAVREIVEKNNSHMITAWGKLYKKSLFQGIRYPKGKYHEDEFVTYKLLYKAKKIVFIKNPLYFYRKRPASITQEKYSYKRLEKLQGLEEAIDFFKEKHEKELEVKARLRYLLNIQIAYYRVKYEIDKKSARLASLKKTYDKVYKSFLADKTKAGLIDKIKLKFFYKKPDLYCFLINKVLGTLEKFGY